MAGTRPPDGPVAKWGSSRPTVPAAEEVRKTPPSFGVAVGVATAAGAVVAPGAPAAGAVGAAGAAGALAAQPVSPRPASAAPLTRTRRRDHFAGQKFETVRCFMWLLSRPSYWSWYTLRALSRTILAASPGARSDSQVSRSWRLLGQVVSE